VLFPAVDKAWKTKVTSIIHRNGLQAGLITQLASFPQLEVF